MMESNLKAQERQTGDSQRNLTTHSTGRAVSGLVIENSDCFSGLCAPVNAGVGRLLAESDAPIDKPLG